MANRRGLRYTDRLMIFLELLVFWVGILLFILFFGEFMSKVYPSYFDRSGKICPTAR